VGVVKDFNYQSLRQSIEPLLIVRTDKPNWYLQVRIAPQDQRSTVESIVGKWKDYNGGTTTDYFFLDRKFNELYISDEIQSKLLTILSVVSILVSILGLIGLSTFNALQRTKEIGIRKVLGANRGNITLLLSKDILFISLLASAIAVPVSFLAVKDWMSHFQYQVDVSYFAILIVIASALLLVFSVIVIQSLKSMETNPATVLRNN